MLGGTVTIKEFKITDSRNVEWKVVVSYVDARYHKPGEDIMKGQRKWTVRFSRLGIEGEIEIKLDSGDVSSEDLLVLLEQHEEWIHDDLTTPSGAPQ